MKKLLSLLLAAILFCSSILPIAMAESGSENEAVLLMNKINQLFVDYYEDEAFFFDSLLMENDEYIVFENEEEEAVCYMRYGENGEVKDVYFDVSGMKGFYYMDMVATVLCKLVSERFGDQACRSFSDWYPKGCEEVVDGLENSDLAMSFLEIDGTDATISLGIEFIEADPRMYVNLEGYNAGRQNSADSPEPAATAVPQPANAPDTLAALDAEAVFVPFCSACNITAEMLGDGTARTNLQENDYETLNLTMQITSYMDHAYYEEHHSEDWVLQGNEASVEFKITLNDYNGSAEVMPDAFLDMYFINADGSISVNGYQLMDAEIGGAGGQEITSGQSKTLYKRYPYSPDTGDMAYVIVEAWVGGEKEIYKFEIPDAGETIENADAPESVPAEDVSGERERFLQAETLKDHAFGRHRLYTFEIPGKGQQTASAGAAPGTEMTGKTVRVQASEKPKMPEVRGEFEYEKSDEGIRVKGFKADSDSPGGMLVIPDEIDGYAVASVNLYDFPYEDQEKIEKIYIEKGVQHFWADNNADFLKLDEIIVEQGNQQYYTIDGVLFSSEDESLILYPPGKAETEYRIPEGIKNISYCAFASCENLKKVVFPDSIETVDDIVLYNCYYLEEVYLGANARFTVAPFMNCHELQRIAISPNNTALTIEDGALVDVSEGIFVYYIRNNDRQNYTVPSGIVKIVDGAFMDASDALTYIELQDGVRKIDRWAFFGLYGENVRVRVPAGVESIDSSAFDDVITLLVDKGSYAENYAKENNQKYEIVSSGSSYSADDDPDTLKMGSSGNRVKEVQQFLIEAGLLHGNADGVYRYETAAAVKRLQQMLNLEETGKVDPLLYHRIFENYFT